MKSQWMLILILIFALLTAIFAVTNVAPVRVNFIFTQTDIPLILVILSSTLLGGLIAALLGMLRHFKLTRTIKQLERRLDESERSLESYQIAEAAQVTTDASALPEPSETAQPGSGEGTSGTPSSDKL
ncbi:lipopolysaccharide assembly LapA domain-containing protein [Paenibacillus sp. YYML68]|uniref:LapA family protein n=1 Tax=Paenibacillus sp. YYML68 TaxID=2909250 RepID=UPI002493AD04|nr:LapA family protein [Paenibacillus sp. YYML68]